MNIFYKSVCLSLLFLICGFIGQLKSQEVELYNLEIDTDLSSGRKAVLTLLKDEEIIWKVNFELTNTEGPRAYLAGIHLTNDTIVVVHYFYQNFNPPDRAIVHYFSMEGEALGEYDLLWKENRVRWLAPKDFMGTSAVDSRGRIYLLGVIEPVVGSGIFKSVLAVFDMKGNKIKENEIERTSKIYSTENGLVELRATGNLVYKNLNKGTVTSLDTKILEKHTTGTLAPIPKTEIYTEEMGKHVGVQLKNVKIDSNGSISYIRDFGAKGIYIKKSENETANILIPYAAKGRNIKNFESFQLEDDRTLVVYVTKEKKIIEVGKKKKKRNKKVFNMYCELYDKNRKLLDSNHMVVDLNWTGYIPIPFAFNSELLYSLRGDQVIVSDLMYKETKFEVSIPTPQGKIAYYPETQNTAGRTFFFSQGLGRYILIKY